MEINRQAAKKMDAMLTDLLAYGQLGQIDLTSVETNCNDALIEAQAHLATHIQKTQAVIKSDPLPTLTLHPPRLSRLFQNLIANALKYQPAGQTPIIRITAQDKTDHWQFAIADNGIGIQKNYLEFIFAPFKRLHGEQEYAGTGLGLAISQRIVESFDGEIWCESDFGKGSVFYFTLPK